MQLNIIIMYKIQLRLRSFRMVRPPALGTPGWVSLGVGLLLCVRIAFESLHAITDRKVNENTNA